MFRSSPHPALDTIDLRNRPQAWIQQIDLGVNPIPLGLVFLMSLSRLIECFLSISQGDHKKTGKFSLGDRPIATVPAMILAVGDEEKQWLHN
ncbi:hypothetical protein H6G58_18130 [Arthrospira platensis FACHB-971]|nr:hypothetical protein [Arthrospira platensis FACHB-971]MBD2667749.1 hypothetical protein [Arthrospira platensis FACHB-439]MBD2709067.1 hypothetical protein [Arthrospira platensis FACHB-835]